MQRSSNPHLGTPGVVALALCVMAAVCASPARAQAPDDSVRTTNESGFTAAQELIRLQDQLRRRTEAALQRRKDQQARLDELDGEARAGRRQNDAIRRQIQKQEARLAEIRTKAETAAARAEEIETREAGLKETMVRFLERLEGRIQRGIPWKIEDRATAVRDAQQIIGDERTSAVSSVATVSRLQKEQEALGRLVEGGTLEVETDTGPKAVQGFHLGLLGVIFASDDGSVLGFAAAGETLEKGLETVRAVPGAAKGYLHTVDILNRRRTPELTDIHLPKLPVEKGGE